MASPFLATLFEWLRRLNGFAVSKFHGLTPVLMPAVFLATRFEWLAPFQVQRLMFKDCSGAMLCIE